MIRYAVDRILTAIPLLLIVGLFAFLLVNLMPGDAASTIAGEGASAAQVESVREDLGLNQPMYAQFFDWVGGVVQGDFGTSFAYNTSVSYLIVQRLEVTISLVALGFVLTVVLGIALGVLSGRNVGNRIDKSVNMFSGLLLAVPTYWIAMLLIIVFVFGVGGFNSTGYTSFRTDVGGWLHSLILPASAIAATSIADVARQVRSTVHTVSGTDFIQSAKAFGLSRRSILFKHVGRNSGVSIVTICGIQIERLIGAAIVIEAIFALPGFGSMLLTSVLQQDLPVVQAAVLLVGAAVIVVNLLVDLSYALINPAIRRT